MACHTYYGILNDLPQTLIQDPITISHNPQEDLHSHERNLPRYGIPSYDILLDHDEISPINQGVSPKELPMVILNPQYFEKKNMHNKGYG